MKERNQSTHTQTQLTRADKNYRSHVQRLNRRDRFASPRLGGIYHASDKLRKALSPRGERSERRGRKGFARQGVGKASQVLTSTLAGGFLAPKYVYCTKYRTMLATASLAGMDHYIGVCLDQRGPPKNEAGKTCEKSRRHTTRRGVCAVAWREYFVLCCSPRCNRCLTVSAYAAIFSLDFTTRTKT